MTVAISLLRAVNVGGHNKIKMEALRTLYESIGLAKATTYIQSGNVVFRTKGPGIAALAARIEKAIEASFGFRPDVMVRTAAELRDVIARNPFASRVGIDPGKLLVSFLGDKPTPKACEAALAIPANPEEFRVSGRELYIYFPNGAGKSKLPIGRIEKALGTSGTGRNWNTVTKLLELAEELERA